MDQIKSAFPGEDKTLYEYLGVSNDASESDIRRAYRKQALKYHPDRGGDAEQFKALSLIHTVLSDSEKRKIYDETGDIVGDSSDLKDFKQWYQYYRNMFPEVTIDSISRFRSTYIGSEEEKADVLRVYSERDGRIKVMSAFIMFFENSDDEERIMKILDNAIDEGLVPALPKYVEYRSKPKSQRKKTFEDRQLLKEVDLSDAEEDEHEDGEEEADGFDEVGEEEEEEEEDTGTKIHSGRKKPRKVLRETSNLKEERKRKSPTSSSKKKSSKNSSTSDSSEDSLAAAILANQRRREERGADFLDNLTKKYSEKTEKKGRK